MAFVPFPNVVKLEAVYQQDGQMMENVFHYQAEVGVSTDEMLVLATEWRDMWIAQIRPLQTIQVALQLIKVTSLEAENAPAIEFTNGLPLGGQASTSQSLPNSVTCAIRWVTDFRGRSYRGRTFHIGLIEGNVDGNRLTTAAQSQLLTAYDSLRGLDGVNQSWNMVVASRISHGVERSTGVATLVTGVVVDPVIDTQRRRLPGRGR